MQTPRRPSRAPAIIAGCLVAALGTVGGCVLTLRACNDRFAPNLPPVPSAPAVRPRPPEVATWGDHAPVILDVERSGSYALRAGAYLVSPESGRFEQWAGGTRACFGDVRCSRVVPTRDKVFAVHEKGALFAIEREGTVSDVDPTKAGGPPFTDWGPVAVSWDGNVVAYDARDKNLRDETVVVDVARGKMLHAPIARDLVTAPLALSPDGTTLVRATRSGLVFTATHGDAGAGTVARGIDSVLALAWSPDGARLLAIIQASHPDHKQTLWVIDAVTYGAKEIAVPEPPRDPYGDVHQYVLAASFSPDGQRLVVLSDIAGVCGHPLSYYGCECSASLYVVAVDGTGWRRLGDTMQGCAYLAWLR